jgi:hypothetical protein
MVTHDPFCPARNHSTTWEPEMCVCDLIAKARADEREKAAQRIEELGCSEHCGWCRISIPNAAATVRGESS